MSDSQQPSRRTVLKGAAVAAGGTMVGALAAPGAAAQPAGAVLDVLVGAVTEGSARVRGKVDGDTARLAVADNPELSGPAFYGPADANARGLVSIDATGLEPDTEYFYGLEVDGAVDTTKPGRFRTHPPLGSPASFAFAAASCAGANTEGVNGEPVVSNSQVFDTIRQHPQNPLFFMHMGDLHYRNIDVDDIAPFRQAYDDVLAQPRQQQLYSHVPLVYVWDDHCYGPNNSDRTSPGREQVAAAYRERMPHYPLAAASGPIYHSFQVGRVLFVVTDNRYERAPNSDPAGPDKTVLGAAQKSWLDSLLASSDAAAMVWFSTTEWMGALADAWTERVDERDELVQMFGDHGWLDRMCVVSGDKHTLAIDTGGGNQAGGFPVFQFAALDAGFDEVPEEQYDTGPSSPGLNRYGTLAIEDSGGSVTVTGTGWIGDQEWRSHTFTAAAAG